MDGRGAFSTVFVAIKEEHEDKGSNTIHCRAVALKRAEKGKIDPQEIKREIQTLVSVSTNCESILNYYDSFEDESFHYLSLDLMVGDLRHFVENETAKKMMQKREAASGYYQWCEISS